MKPTDLYLILFLIAAFGVVSCDKDDKNTLTGNDSGLYDLYLYDVSSHETTRITSSPEQLESFYSFSPDNKKILYKNENGINEMNIDGTGNKVLISKGSSPAYSPDGTKIAFTDENRLWLINSDGTNKVKIVDKDINFWYPVWSHNGEKIACSSDSGLCIVSLNGNYKVIVKTETADWYDWSYDSNEIFYSKFVNNKYAQIFKFNLIQNKEYQLTENYKYNYNAKCNPIANNFLFTSSESDYGGDIIISGSDGKNSQVILHRTHLDNPCWSPTGDKIAFITDNSDLAIIDKTGDNYKIINKISQNCMEPKWSPDGKYILYYRAVFYL